MTVACRKQAEPCSGANYVRYAASRNTPARNSRNLQGKRGDLLCSPRQFFLRHGGPGLLPRRLAFGGFHQSRGALAGPDCFIPGSQRLLQLPTGRRRSLLGCWGDFGFARGRYAAELENTFAYSYIPGTCFVLGEC